MQGLLRKIVIMAVCLSLSVFGALTMAFAEDESENQTVTVGVFEFDGYHMQGEDGSYSGYGIELLQLIERYSHLNFEMVGYDCSWADMIEMLNDGQIDMVTSARRTPAREAQFEFSLPVGTNRTLLTTSLHNKDIISGNYATYDDMVIGVVAGSTQNALLAPFAEDKGFTYQTVEFEDTKELTQALQDGSIDAILSSDLRRSRDEKTLDTLDVRDFYAIVRKGDTQLIHEIDYAIEQIDLHEGDWQNRLYYQFYGADYSSTLDFTEREQAYIEEVRSGKKSITATAAINRSPYSYVVGEELRGILMDYFAAVMEVAGLPYEVIVPQDAEQYDHLVETNGVDVVIDAMADTDDLRVIDDGYNGFNTDPYMETGFAVVTGQDSNGAIHTIAVDDARAQDLVKKYVNDDAEIILYPSTESTMQAVADGKVDAAYVYSYSAQQYINRDDDKALHFGLVHDLGTEFVMYVPDSTDHELVTILDKCIQMVPRSKLDQLIAEYTTYSLDDLTIAEFIRANPAIAWTIGIIFLAGILVIIAAIVRYRWSQRLLHAKDESNKELGKQLAIVEALSRDYTNVYAIDADRGIVKVIKLEGYVTEGLEKDANVEYEYEPILSTYIDARVHPDEREILKQELALDVVTEVLKNADEYIGTYRILSMGEEHHFQYTYRFLKRGRQAGTILAGFRNIDETIRSEQEQKELLSEALKRAQYANKAKTTFLNNMSHDIRTPMNAIIGFSSLATAHLDEPDQVQDYLNKILTSSNHLLSLINDVLDMSRIESGKVQFEEKEVSIPEVLRDLRVIVQTDVKQKQLDLEMTSEITDEVVFCDKLRLNQVLLNVLSNGIKYTKPGGKVTMKVTQLTAVHDGFAEYEFRVKDTGIGMSAEFLEHVFEPFERENTATVSGIQGTGLGLAITKNIIDTIGGDISVTSQVGMGSEFVIRFPFRVAEASALLPAASEEPPAEEDEHDGFEGKHILLVEDNELNLEIALAILEKAGFVVDSADDGVTGFQKMEEMAAGTYDLILTDIQMPIMDGYELANAVRAMDDPDKASIPIVAMTANAFEEDREQAMAVGMNGYVPKPINVATLMSVLKEVL